MGKPSRDKGAAGERALVRLLCEWLGESAASRNLDQVRDGGVRGDVAGDVSRHFAIECKSTRASRFPQWFEQAQAQAGDKIPVVAWKRTGSGKFQFYVLMDEQEFINYARETLNGG